VGPRGPQRGHRAWRGVGGAPVGRTPRGPAGDRVTWVRGWRGYFVARTFSQLTTYDDPAGYSGHRARRAWRPTGEWAEESRPRGRRPGTTGVPARHEESGTPGHGCVPRRRPIALAGPWHEHPKSGKLGLSAHGLAVWVSLRPPSALAG
jgi:hypothetical protein